MFQETGLKSMGLNYPASGHELNKQMTPLIGRLAREDCTLFVGTLTNLFWRDSWDMVEAARVLKNGSINEINYVLACLSFFTVVFGGLLIGIH